MSLVQLYTGIILLTRGLQSDAHGSSQPAAPIRILSTVLINPILAGMIHSPFNYMQLAPFNARITALLDNPAEALTNTYI